MQPCSDAEGMKGHFLTATEDISHITALVEKCLRQASYDKGKVEEDINTYLHTLRTRLEALEQIMPYYLACRCAPEAFAVNN